VQTPTKTETIEFNGWTLRVRPANTANLRLLVMIHGWTGDENSMWVFARKFSADKYWIVAPRAPHAADPQGFSWRPPHAQTFGRPSLEMLLPSAEALIQLVDEYSAAVRVEAETFDVIGFSQGGAMVNVLGFVFPERIRKMAVLAGFVPSGLESHIDVQPLVGKKIFVAHGTLDELVPVERARASMDLLEQAGAEIVYCEDEVGHKLSANCLRALEEYLDD
jgi:phospholipase/carboxylesterase